MGVFNDRLPKTEEEWKKLFKLSYDDYKKNKNNFSYWYEKVKDCGIKMVECRVYKIPFSQYINSHSEHKEKKRKFQNYIRRLIKDLSPVKFYNIKNATFSNKFDFDTCISTKEDIPKKIDLINYIAACVGADGYTELIVRDVIEYDAENIPTIYRGMPLRSEFRVFYDFDKKEILYSVNYWDYDCCNKYLCVTDRIVFEHERERLDSSFNERKDEVEQLVKEHMKDVKLNGKWSIDILYNELEDDYYLIDMAEAHKSAYWRG